MNKEILPECPFCGAKAKEEPTHGEWEGHGLKTIYCQNCSASANRKDWVKRLGKEIL